jgi:predicted nucleic acid-binding protein
LIYLLDVNALLALGHTAHVHHLRVSAWVGSLDAGRDLATCSITELGFVRIAPQARLSPDVAASQALLAQLGASTRPRFVRLADDLGADSLPDWVKLPAHTTDGHLAALARARSAQLATLDEGIPDSFLIPADPEPIPE